MSIHSSNPDGTNMNDALANLTLEYERLKTEHHRLAVDHNMLQSEHHRLMTDHQMMAHHVIAMYGDAIAAQQVWKRLRQEAGAPPPGYRYQLVPLALQMESTSLLSTGSAPFINSQEIALPLQKIRSEKEYFEVKRNLGDEGYALESVLATSHADKREFYLVGYCEACDQVSRFRAQWAPGEAAPNFRESLNCERCALFSRLRKVVGYLRSVLHPDQNDIYLYEQITGFYDWMKRAFAERNVVGSEYLGDHLASGSVVDGVRHEDATAMSFADESFDYLISCDVFEHVPDIKRTLAEASRILRTGGRLIITVPFHPSKQVTEQRATLVDGKLTHLLPEEYHLNPVSAEGSLVFYDYGWDFLDFFREAGFSDAYMQPYYSLWQAHLGMGLQSIFIAEK